MGTAVSGFGHWIRGLATSLAPVGAFAALGLLLYALLELVSSTLVELWTLLMIAFHP